MKEEAVAAIMSIFLEIPKDRLMPAACMLLG
jgi:hypothetical protein